MRVCHVETPQLYMYKTKDNDHVCLPVPRAISKMLHKNGKGIQCRGNSPDKKLAHTLSFSGEVMGK